MKRPGLLDTGVALAVHGHCSGPRKAELRAVLPGDIVSSRYDSFKKEDGLEKAIHRDTREVPAQLFRSR